ncbi:hypothetical protein AMQ83_03990 [Paenibacillus riograndensis]|nr:hypothetical protein AMQ83_03990 [Paenibacillus riograndensis]
MKNRAAKITGIVLLFSLALSLIAGSWANTTVHAAGLSITGSGGWNETAYVECAPVSNGQGYSVYVKPARASDYT